MSNELVKKRVLVVEDEPIIARVCSRVLSSEGFLVDIASNGLLAKGMLQNAHYDICVSDIRIPEMSGMELFQYIKSEFATLAGNTIFISGDVLNNEVKKFLTDNPVRFLAKPFSPHELTTAISQLISEEKSLQAVNGR
jgi:CheY-like chemotaxis protein